MIPLSAIVEEFEQGAWVADCEFSEKPTGSFELGSETWSGTVLASQLEGGRYLTRIVGGKGGLAKGVTDLQYRGAIGLNKIFADVCKLAGETLGETLTDRVINYDRMRGTAGQALDSLCLTFGCAWRITRAGSASLYRPVASSEVAANKYTRVGSDIDGAVFLAVQSSSDIALGQTVGGKRIRSIRWCLNKSRLVAECSPDPVAAGDLRQRLDFLKTYSAKVERQNADGSLDLIVAGRFGLSQVPLLVGVPVAKVQLVAGDLVNVGFYEYDPRKPYAICTGQGSGSKAVARVDDTADCGTLILGTLSTPAAPGSPVTIGFQYVPPGPNHDNLVRLATTGLAAFTPQSIRLKAVITSGQERVKL